MSGYDNFPNISGSLQENGDKYASHFKEIMIENDALMQENRLLQAHMNRITEGEEVDAGDLPGSDTLSPSQLYKICQTELNALQKELVDVDVRTAKDVVDLNAMIGETKIRINELKKEAYEFKRDIVIGGENQCTKKVCREREMEVLCVCVVRERERWRFGWRKEREKRERE